VILLTEVLRGLMADWSTWFCVISFVNLLISANWRNRCTHEGHFGSDGS
jgi:hypothetical protein